MDVRDLMVESCLDQANQGGYGAVFERLQRVAGIKGIVHKCKLQTVDGRGVLGQGCENDYSQDLKGPRHYFGRTQMKNYFEARNTNSSSRQQHICVTVFRTMNILISETACES